jgi:hypothetical protein
MTGSTGGQGVSRWMGASVCRMPGSVVEQLLGMREGICRLNQRTGLRTALLYSSGWFLQWHEGSAAAVADVWQRSLTHPGHAHARLIHRSVGAPRLAESLHIATLHNRDKPSDVARRLYGIEREHELGWSADPAEIWQLLSAPCMLKPPNPAASVARRHVVAVTSEFTESVDLIKVVADRGRAPVSYQRFASGDVRAGEAGAAYVDMAEGGHMTRLQALSRRALANSMIRLSLRNMQCLVLLTGTRPHHASRLAAAARDLLGDTAVCPSVRVVGPCAQTRGEAMAVLSALPGLDVAQVEPGRSTGTLVDSVLGAIANRGDTMPAPLDALRG